MSTRRDFMIGSIGILSISAMPKLAEDTNPMGVLLSEDGPPPEQLPPEQHADMRPPSRQTKTFGTGVKETRVKGGDRSPDDSGADPDWQGDQ